MTVAGPCQFRDVDLEGYAFGVTPASHLPRG